MSKAILGGGLGGLSAAYYLTRNNPRQAVTLIEKSSRVGGWIKSDLQTNGTVFEQGPRTIRPRGASGLNTLQLIEELGLSQKIVPILSSSPAAKNRMIWANGKLHMLPSSFLGFFQKNSLFSKPLIGLLFNDLLAPAPRKTVQDESIYDFIHRRFGSEVADYLISPMICGICAGNSKEISVKFLLQTLFEWEQKFGSISQGFVRDIFQKLSDNRDKMLEEPSKLISRAKSENWSIYSFEGGCETLPRTLKQAIKANGVRFELNKACQKITTEKNGVLLHLSDDSTTKFDHVISSIPAQTLAPLLHDQHPDLSHMLDKIKSASVAVINFQFDKKLLSNEAFGFLVPPREQIPILGVIFDSCCFPNTQDNNCLTTLTVMMGGFWFEHYFGKNPAEQDLLKVAQKYLDKILRITEQPVHFKVNILHQCIPQCVVGHQENLLKIEQYVKERNLPISLCGASYYGVGVNDVILSAKNAVDKLS